MPRNLGGGIWPAVRRIPATPTEPERLVLDIPDVGLLPLSRTLLTRADPPPLRNTPWVWRYVSRLPLERGTTWGEVNSMTTAVEETPEVTEEQNEEAAEQEAADEE